MYVSSVKQIAMPTFVLCAHVFEKVNSRPVLALISFELTKSGKRPHPQHCDGVQEELILNFLK